MKVHRLHLVQCLLSGRYLSASGFNDGCLVLWWKCCSYRLMDHSQESDTHKYVMYDLISEIHCEVAYEQGTSSETEGAVSDTLYVHEMSKTIHIFKTWALTLQCYAKGVAKWPQRPLQRSFWFHQSSRNSVQSCSMTKRTEKTQRPLCLTQQEVGHFELSGHLGFCTRVVF